MKRLLWLLAGTFVFAAALLVVLPASWLVSQVPASLPLQLGDVRGSVWRGSISRVHWQGRELGSLVWQVHPLGLLRGRVEADVLLTGEIIVEARIERGWSVWRATGVKAVLPAAWLDPVIASPGLHPQGELQAQIDEAELREGRLTAMTGVLHWQDASVAGAAVAALGDLRAEFALAQDGRVHGRIHDDDGPLALSGDFVADLSGYQAQVRLLARDARLAPALRWLGQAQPDGSRLLLLQGTR